MISEPILIVEDDRDIRENLSELLEGEGYSVLLAANGRDAVDLLRSGIVKPFLIFLDLMMPVMDGRTFLKETQKDPLLAGIPVIVVTAAAEKLDGQIAGFLKKPLDLDQVLAAAERHALASPR